MNIWIVIAVGCVLATIIGWWLIATANRLDRLHVRLDATWAGLDAVLRRRATVASSISGAGIDASLSSQLRVLAAAVETTPRAEREIAENELTHVLSQVPRPRLADQVAEELSDAEHRMVIARRVYNDAVRDTLALRRTRRVRYFKLAGTAPIPEYFEVVEPISPPPFLHTPER